jgi:hypothetical protein
MWDWADPKAICTTRSRRQAESHRQPERPIYGALEASADYLPVIDPKNAHRDEGRLTVRDPKTPSEADTPPAQAVAVLGRGSDLDEQGQRAQLRDGQTEPRLDSPLAFARTRRRTSASRDRVIRPRRAFPLPQSGRQMQMYDPKTKKVTTVDTCFGTHHLNFDDNDVLWFTGGGPVEGWFDTKIYDKTGDETKAQGWTAFVVDTNGNGKRDAYVEPDQPLDPAKDKRVNVPFYGVAPSPVDGSVWGSVLGMPGYLFGSRSDRIRRRRR